MFTDKIWGQERAILALGKAFENKRIANAYFFFGPDGVGKKSTALEFARFLNGETASNENPDIILLEPEKNNIKIDQIRQLKEWVQYGPTGSGHLVAIVDQAHSMQNAAANSFLKILEEPPARVVFILIGINKEGLPSTILSRSQGISFNSLSNEIVKKILAKESTLEPIKIDLITKLAAGSAGKAFAIADGIEEQQDFLDQARQRFKNINASSYSDLIKLAEEIHNEDISELLLSLVMSESRADLWAGNQNKLTTFKRIVDCQKALKKNANSRLALEAMLLRIKSESVNHGISCN